MFNKLFNILRLRSSSNLPKDSGSNTLPDTSVDHISHHNQSVPEAYAITLLLYSCRKVGPIPTYYPLYFSRECGLTNPQILHQKLIDEGFFYPASLYDLLTTLKVTDLKKILQSYGLEVSGKKEDLIQRILSEGDVEDIRNFFKDTEPHYSLSVKGKSFLKAHEDYVHFHRYSKYGIKLNEYESCKSKMCSNNCEEILICICKEKLKADKYAHLYHVFLRELYDTCQERSNALYEFLIIKYFAVNYIHTFSWLNSYTNHSAQSIYETQKSIFVLSPDDAAYFVKHIDVYSSSMLDKIYHEYPLKNIMVSKSEFDAILSEMSTDSFFDVAKWNSFLLAKLKNYLKL